MRDHIYHDILVNRVDLTTIQVICQQCSYTFTKNEAIEWLQERKRSYEDGVKFYQEMIDEAN